MNCSPALAPSNRRRSLTLLFPGMGEEHPPLLQHALEGPWGSTLLCQCQGLARGGSGTSPVSPLLSSPSGIVLLAHGDRGASSPWRWEICLASRRSTDSCHRRLETFGRAGSGEEAPGQRFCFGFPLPGGRASSPGRERLNTSEGGGITPGRKAELR